MNPELPADLFTSCLTTPIKVALRWWVFLKALLEVTFLIYAMPEICLKMNFNLGAKKVMYMYYPKSHFN